MQKHERKHVAVLNELWHGISNNVVCATSKASEYIYEGYLISIAYWPFFLIYPCPAEPNMSSFGKGVDPNQQASSLKAKLFCLEIKYLVCACKSMCSMLLLDQIWYM